MFIPCAQKSKLSSAYYEFQFCKKDLPVSELVKTGYSHWAQDSLLLHIDHDETFFKAYLSYMKLTNAPNGTTDFCYFGINYYTKAQTKAILDQIKEEKPLGHETLVPWLEKAVTEYNGFFFLGI